MNKEMKLAELRDDLVQWTEQQSKNNDLFARFDDVEVRSNLIAFNRLINLYTYKIKSSIRYYENQ